MEADFPLVVGFFPQFGNAAYTAAAFDLLTQGTAMTSKRVVTLPSIPAAQSSFLIGRSGCSASKQKLKVCY